MICSACGKEMAKIVLFSTADYECVECTKQVDEEFMLSLHFHEFLTHFVESQNGRYMPAIEWEWINQAVREVGVKTILGVEQ